jgi:thiamine biosynthesis protein ThiS
MLVTCNGKPVEVEEQTTVAQLLSVLNYRRAAVWINGVQLLASEYENRLVGEADQIRILRIVAGG